YLQVSLSSPNCMPPRGEWLMFGIFLLTCWALVWQHLRILCFIKRENEKIKVYRVGDSIGVDSGYCPVLQPFQQWMRLPVSAQWKAALVLRHINQNNHDNRLPWDSGFFCFGIERSALRLPL